MYGEDTELVDMKSTGLGHSTVLQTDDSEHLKSLIASGNLASVTTFLCKKGAFVNSILLIENDETTFPLHVAVDVNPSEYHHDLVKFLLSEGPDLNLLDSSGYAPLHYAAKRGNLNAIRALLDAGANVNLQTDQPKVRPPFNCISFPLHLALYSRWFDPDETADEPLDDIVQVFLSHGANCNIRDGMVGAPLRYAVEMNDISLTVALLEAGTDVNVYQRAMCLGEPSLLRILFSGHVDPEVLNRDGQSFLSVAIHVENLDMVRYLVAEMPLFLYMKSDIGEFPLPAVVEYYAEGYTDYMHKNTEPPGEDYLKTIYLMLKAGYPVSTVFKREEWKIWEDELSWIPEGEELLKAMEEIASNPRSLLDLCTISIRSTLQKNFTSAVESLPLPSRLKETLTLVHFT